MTELPDKELLRPDEVANYFSVTRKTVYLWIKKKHLEAYKIDKAIRITRKSILEHKKL